MFLEPGMVGIRDADCEIVNGEAPGTPEYSSKMGHRSRWSGLSQKGSHLAMADAEERRRAMNSQDRQRTRIGKGIYRDAWGIAATVKVGGASARKTLPPGHVAQDDQGLAGRNAGGAPEACASDGARHFAADAARYLKAVAAMPTFKEREKHIALWSAEFGQRARYTITTADVDTVLSRWLNRRQVACDRAQPSNGAPAPVEPPRRARRAEPRTAGAEAGASGATSRGRSATRRSTRSWRRCRTWARALAGKARDDASKTKARLAVIAFTGLPHSLVKRLSPESVNWQIGTIDVPTTAQRKGRRRRGP